MLRIGINSKGEGMGKTIDVAVVNGTGYGGIELLRLLSAHPHFRVIEVTARSDAGKELRHVFPSLSRMQLSFTEEVHDAELVFIALPDRAAIDAAMPLIQQHRKVVDLSAGFRLKSPAEYPVWYGYEHPASSLLEQAVYGLPEWNRDSISNAQLIACPGCYPTAALLALLPAMKRDL